MFNCIFLEVAILLGFFIKKPSKIATSKKEYQSYCLPIAQSYLHKQLISNDLCFGLMAMGYAFKLEFHNQK